MTQTTLEVVGITKSFVKQKVLRDITFTIPTNKVVAIKGRSGCGKSTLLKIIAGLVPQDSGQVYIGGRESSRIDTYHRGVAYIFQGAVELFPWLTPAAIIGFAVKKYARLNPSDQINVADEVRRVANMTRVSPELLSRKIMYLSGGERQRVSLARALAERPKLLLADEPLANLDVPLQEELFTVMRDLFAETGMTVLYVSHNPRELTAVADQVLSMVDGQIREMN